MLFRSNPEQKRGSWFHSAKSGGIQVTVKAKPCGGRGCSDLAAGDLLQKVSECHDGYHAHDRCSCESALTRQTGGRNQLKEL